MAKERVTGVLGASVSLVKIFRLERRTAATAQRFFFLLTEQADEK